MITPFKMPFSNVYAAASGAGFILFDAGAPRDFGRLEVLARQFGGLKRAGALFLTHAHFDHCGTAAHLQSRYGIAVYAPKAARDICEGRSAYKLSPRDLFGHAIDRLLPKRFPSFTADHWLDGADTRVQVDDLSIQVLATSGHTDHCLSYILPGGAAVTGDLIMGGWPAGLWSQGRAFWHHIASSVTDTRESLARVLDQDTVEFLYPGHGSPVNRAQAVKLLEAAQ